jgi:prepilin-type N-terminal cleavage/methylation domain-containing protein/prepilin-type processing-associated H-X9-DG protein
MTSGRRRRGFTLIELLVVISIIGILVGLLLPAVNSAREAGRRVKCQSNMRNIVLGLLNYNTTNNTFPPAGMFGEAPSGVGTANPNTVLLDPTTGAVASWMPGGTGTVGVPMYSWVLLILPFIDQQDMFDQWSQFAATGGPVPYYDDGKVATLNIGQASNLKISETAIGVLICPDDNTVQTGSGNLSYAVNGGFSLYPPVPVGWVGSPTDGLGTISAPNIWSLAGDPKGGQPVNVYQSTQAVTQRLGVMYVNSTFFQGDSTRLPWNVRSTLANVTDGSSSTLLVSENTLTGVSSGNTNSVSQPTNWATPMPTFALFIGATNICGTPSATAAVDCTSNNKLLPLQAAGDLDGPGWAFANKIGTYANINGGLSLTTEGGYPFTNSNHPGGSNMGFCDGAVRFVTNSIDGTVYSKMITAGGQKLPVYAKQLPLSQDAFAP